MSESASPEHGTFLLHRNRGREHFEAEEYALARSDLELASSIRDDDPDVMYWLAIACFRLDRHEEAESLFANLMELRPGHASLHVNRGIALFKLDRSEEAEREFRQGLELDDAGNRPHLYLGLTHARRAEYETALTHFEQAGASLLASQMRQRLGWGRKKPSTSAAPLSPDPPVTLQDVRPATNGVVPECELPAEQGPEAAVEVSTLEAPPRPADGLPELITDSGTAVNGPEVTVHGGALLRMTVRGIALAHREALSGSAGSLGFERSAQHEQLVRVTGDGSLYLLREDRRLATIPLAGEVFHVILERFVASLGELAREVSTSAEETLRRMRTLELHGSGVVGVSLAGQALLLEVEPGRPVTLSAQRLVGWMGELQVSQAGDHPISMATGLAMVGFEGQGRVILDVPLGPDPRRLATRTDAP